MRRRITWRSAAAISMLGLAPAIGAAFAVPAGASTYACAAALGTQCGTFTENAYNATTARPLGAPTPPSGDQRRAGMGRHGRVQCIQHPADRGPELQPRHRSGYRPDESRALRDDPRITGGSVRISDTGTRSSTRRLVSGRPCACPTPITRAGTVATWSCGPATSRSGRRSWLSRSPVAIILRLLPPGGGNRPKPQLPPAPNWRAPTRSVPIPNLSSTSAYALYSMANGRFVEVAGAHGMSVAAPGPGGPGPGPGPGGPGPKGGALSATAHSGEPVTNTNTWFWTNANGPVNPMLP